MMRRVLSCRPRAAASAATIHARCCGEVPRRSIDFAIEATARAAASKSSAKWAGTTSPPAQGDAPSELRQCLFGIFAVELSGHLDRMRQGRREGVMDGDVAIASEFREEPVEGIRGKREWE
jgi:hypothetical protein